MAFLPIYKGRGAAKTVVGQALVDDDSLPQLQHLELRYIGKYPGARVPTETGGRELKVLHYIVWELVHGNDPPVPLGFLDHANQDVNDNRLENLVPVDGSMKIANSPRHRDNTTGYKGVSRKGSRFRAAIGYAKETMYLGIYDRAVEAAHAVNVAYEIFYPDVPTPNRISPADLDQERKQEIDDNVRRLVHPRRAPYQR